MRVTAGERVMKPRIFTVLLTALAIAGCSSGTKLLKDPKPLEVSPPLAQGANGRIAASIDAVIVRNGHGAWARDADWDEYLIRVHAVSDEPVRITDVAIFDALDTRVASVADRGRLVEASRETERRYQKSGQLVKSQVHGGWMLAGGAAATVAGMGIAYSVASASAMGSIMGGTAAASSASGAVMVLPLAAVVGGAYFAGRGIVRMVNNAQVNGEIQRRQTVLPVAMSRGESARLDLFFPLTPLPSRVEIVYADAGGEQRLAIDTRTALAALHLDPTPTLEHRENPEFPKSAERAGIERGYVKAKLKLDAEGNVREVEILESVPPEAFDGAAIRAFWRWQYSKGNYDNRVVDASIEFKR